MELEGMSEIDLNGVLFIHFPYNLSLEECRERLELGIAEEYESLCEGLEEDERPKLCISPYWCYMAMRSRHHRELEKLSKDEMKKYIALCWEEREKEKIKAKERNSVAGLTNPTEK